MGKENRDILCFHYIHQNLEGYSPEPNNIKYNLEKAKLDFED